MKGGDERGNKKEGKEGGGRGEPRTEPKTILKRFNGDMEKISFLGATSAPQKKSPWGVGRSLRTLGARFFQLRDLALFTGAVSCDIIHCVIEVCYLLPYV